MKIIFPASFLLVVALFPFLVMADEMPQLKPGLWEVSGTADGHSAGVSKQCVDENTAQEFLTAGQKMLGGACSKMKFTKSGGTHTSMVKCKIGPTQMTAKSEISGNFDSKYTTNTVATFSPPLMGKSKSVSTTYAEYKGECGPNMKPGDMITPDGKKTNILTMMEKMPDMTKMMDQMNEIMKKMPQQMPQ